MKKKAYYGAINGLRAISALGILMMHVKSNCEYRINGWFYNTCIASFTDLVFLFMVISSFGMCCGYYEKIINNTITLTEFYNKRIRKILPFFSILVLLDLIAHPSFESLCEAFADITLMFGFLPNSYNITIIGVGWFIGLVFVFYIGFPFFCTLITSKKRAWIAFGICLGYNFLCTYYFNAGRNNILYSACFFVAGGLLYLYRDVIVNINKWVMLVISILTITLYYGMNGSIVGRLLVSIALLMYAMTACGGILDNKICSFLGGISMEIYLSHMLIFRMVEKMGLNYALGCGWISFFFTVFLVLAGTIIFAIITKKGLDYIEKKISSRRLGKECNGR